MIKLFYPNFWHQRSFLAKLLLPLSWLYSLASRVRVAWVKPVRFPARTICIGNASVGGTGKTLLVTWLAQELAASERNFVLLCRGYRSNCTQPTMVTPNSSVEEVGDEALELAKFGPTIATPDYREALPILEQIKPELIIVDDGMQNPGFIKDQILMLVDGMRGFGNGFLLPAGPLRTNFQEAINLADAVIISEPLLYNFPYPRDKTFFAEISTTIKYKKNLKYLAFAGIGNPDRFFASLLTNGLNVVDSKSFPDHHEYSNEEVQELIAHAQIIGAQLITTPKDFTKLEKYSSYLTVFHPTLKIKHKDRLLKLIK